MMERSVALLIGLVFCAGMVQSQSLAEVAKKEKERRLKNDEPVRVIDSDGLEEVAASSPRASDSGSTVTFAPPTSPPVRGPSASRLRRQRPASPAPPSPPSSRTRRDQAPPQGGLDPSKPIYVEDHLYGEENVRKLRRQASECRMKEGPSAVRCAMLEDQARRVEKLLRERRSIR